MVFKTGGHFKLGGHTRSAPLPFFFCKYSGEFYFVNIVEKPLNRDFRSFRVEISEALSTGEMFLESVKF